MAQLKSTLVQGALTVTGNAVASKLIKNGGTSDDILLGDGSTTSKSALMAMINAAVVLKGTAGTNGTVTKTTFPAASESTLGDAYKVITKDTYQGVAAKVGDMLICYYTGSKYEWMLIPSGDDIEDTWREIKVNGTQILANGTTTNALNLKAGTNMTLTNSNGTVTFDATDTGATTISITGDGNAFTNAEYNASTRTITFTKGSKFLTSHQSLANYVTLNGAQTITGVKTFSAQPVISTANGLKFDSGNCKLRIYNTSASPTDYAAIEVRSNSASTNRNLFIDLANNSLVVGAASGTADTAYKVNVKDTFNATTIYENGTSLANKYADKNHNHNGTYLTAEVDTLQTVTNRGATTNKAITTAGLTTTSTLYITGTTGHREGIRIAPFGNLSSIWWNATGTQDYTTGQMWGITAYDKGYNLDATKTNTFRFRGPDSSTATSATDQMWINTSGLVTSRGGFAKSGSSDSYVLLAGGGTKAISDITGTTYDADRGISLKNGKFGHSNTAVTAVTTAGLYKIKYDAYGHITGTEAFTLPTVNNGTLTIQKNGTKVATFTANQSSNATANITVPDPLDYYWANVKVSSSSSTATTPSVQKLGITGSTATTAAAAVTMEYDSGYKALKFVFA